MTSSSDLSRDPPGAPSRRRVWLFRAIALLTSVGLALGLLEEVLRRQIELDVDGNETALGARLEPFHLPVERTRRNAARLAGAEEPCFRYHRDLGWEPPRRAQCHNDLYVYDRLGLRAPEAQRVITPKPAPGVLRIGLLGDSFTHGDGVVYEITWGHQLELQLRERGVEAEVLNLGVGGYGIDQALLRWRGLGRRLGLHVVILGFQAEDVLRDLNMVRSLYWWQTQLPFSKPRFVLRDDALVVVNQPAVRPEALPAVLADFDAWPLVEHESFYDPERYRRRWWHEIRLLGYFAAWKAHEQGQLEYAGQGPYFELGTPSATLTLRLVEALQQEVQEAGAELYVVHLPKRIDLERLREDADAWYGPLREAIAQRAMWIETDAALEAAIAAGESVFRPSDHHAPAGHRAVARAVADGLDQSIRHIQTLGNSTSNPALR